MPTPGDESSLTDEQHRGEPAGLENCPTDKDRTEDPRDDLTDQRPSEEHATQPDAVRGHTWEVPSLPSASILSCRSNPN